jgi:hypothetical protein
MVPHVTMGLKKQPPPHPKEPGNFAWEQITSQTPSTYCVFTPLEIIFISKWKEEERWSKAGRRERRGDSELLEKELKLHFLVIGVSFK